MVHLLLFSFCSLKKLKPVPSERKPIALSGAIFWELVQKLLFFICLSGKIIKSIQYFISDPVIFVLLLISMNNSQILAHMNALFPRVLMRNINIPSKLKGIKIVRVFIFLLNGRAFFIWNDICYYCIQWIFDTIKF